MRVGSSVVKKTDVRIVAATNVDLEKAIGNGRLRGSLLPTQWCPHPHPASQEKVG